MKLGLFYGTTTGFTETAAGSVRDLLGSSLSLYKNISEVSVEEMSSCDQFILAIPTWDVGQLQSDWWAFFPKLDSIDFHEKKVAFIGIGDQYGYPDTFLDAMGDCGKKSKSVAVNLLANGRPKGMIFQVPSRLWMASSSDLRWTRSIKTT